MGQLEQVLVPGGDSPAASTGRRTATGIWPYVKIARVDHWLKNVFIFPGVLFAMHADSTVLDWGLLWMLPLATLAVCLAASSNYVINEVLDARRDRLHPEKKTRQVASGHVRVPIALAEWVVLGAAAVAIAFAMSWSMGVWVLALLLAGVFYNLPPMRTKDLPYLDVISEGANNPIRLMIGWHATGTALIVPISLLLSYWALGAFLMAVKRFAEYRHLNDQRRASAYRPSFRHYSEPRLLISILFYATACAMFAGVFIARYRVELVLTVPIFAVFMAAYFRLGFKPNSPAQHPERLLKSGSMILATVVLTAAVVSGLWIDSPKLREMFAPTIPHQLVEPARLPS